MPGLRTNRSTSLLWLALALALAAPGTVPVRAQEAVLVGSMEKSLQVRRATTRPVIDGRMDEAVWQTAIPVDDFHEIQPTEYAAVSERTVVYVLYDDDAVYIGARMYDANPEQITARILRQGEQVFGDDWFAVHIDPFYDRRSGYRFLTNPNAIRQEGIFQNVTDTEWEWEGIWYTAASVDAEGWVTEIEIPLKSISFDPTGDTWGINFRRAIARRDERVGWVSRNRDTGPASSGTAVGFEGLQQGVGLDVVPSATVGRGRTFATDPGAVSVSSDRADPALDVFWRITPGLTSALTVNTDFSATEVDDRQVNLTRFGLFFPEKRDFFLQDADIFEFGTLAENGRPFFSRSIGLSGSGVPVDIEAGGKLTGRVGRFNVGALAVRQDDFGAVTADTAIVARVSANLLEESSVGMILTEGDPGSNLDNSLAGFDFSYRNTRLPNGRTLQSTLWLQQSETEGIEGDDQAWGLRIQSPNETGWRGGMRFSHIEENFNPGLGFVNNRGIEQTNMGTEYTWRPTDGWLRSILTGLNFERTTLIEDGSLQQKRRTIRLLEIEMSQGDELTVRNHWRNEVLIEPFEISAGIVIPVGSYAFRDFNIELETADHRRIWGSFDYRIGPFFGGDRVQMGGSVSWRPAPRFFGSIGYETNEIHLPQGNFTTRLASYRAEFVISPKLSWVTLVQYDNVSEVAGINTRLHWIPEPGQEGFIVINHNVQDFDLDNRFQSLASDVSVKFSYTFRY